MRSQNMLYCFASSTFWVFLRGYLFFLSLVLFVSCIVLPCHNIPVYPLL